jgi:hypothetical protein
LRPRRADLDVQECNLIARNDKVIGIDCDTGPDSFV